MRSEVRNARVQGRAVRRALGRLGTGLLPVLVALLAALPAAAQQTRVGGSVSAAESGQALAGVNVMVKGTPIGTLTNTEGRFTLVVPSLNDTLVFALIGFAEHEEPLNGRTSVDVSLAISAVALEEIVVTGYGVQQRRDVTGSVARVSGSEVTELATPSVVQSLQGRVAGMQVSPSSGEPGASAIIRIRGVGTLNDASPLFVVDGMLVDDIQFLTPEDVESVEVLKDASATAIYGSRGANGVIIVTTKKGTESRTTSYTFGAYAGTQSVLDEIRDESHPAVQKIDLPGGGESVHLSGALFGDSDPRVVDFAGYRLGTTPQMHLTYLMWKRGVGFRVGTSGVYSQRGKSAVGIRQRCLQEHADATVYVDAAAASELTRVRTPWLLREVQWTPELTDRACIWLSRRIETPLLRLTTHDFRENHLGNLIAAYDSVDRLTKSVFARLAAKVRDNELLPAGRRVIVFSPHPDDDVISMGGMLRKLHENRNEITVAYMTSGNIAVFDHEVRRYLDFIQRFEHYVLGDSVSQLDELVGRIEISLASKKPGEVDIREVQDIKRHIREAEAVSGVEALGISRGACRFLNLPFYRTGTVRKNEIGPDDVRIVRELLEEVRPEVIFVAGDLSDPHGTHRQCKQAIDRALEEYDGARPEVWLYRGAWQEWAIHEADVFVPLTREDLRRKIFAIFKHQSQKDKAPFPGGHDEREFWQRVDARNRGTAEELDRLGLPEFHAAEAFVVR